MKENSGGTLNFERGIDLAFGQEAADWKSASAAGVKFGYVFATRGLTERCQHFEENWRDMKKAGVLRGACHYFQPLKDAEAQARHFIKVVGELEADDLPPALRLKTVLTQTGLNEWEALRREQRLTTIKRCLAALEQAFRRKPVLCSNAWFLENQLGDTAELGAYDLWLADYGKLAGGPAQCGPWKFWRYTDNGKVAGVTGRVSLDYFNGSQSDLLQYVGAAGTSPEKEGEAEEATEPAAASSPSATEPDQAESAALPTEPVPAKRSSRRDR